MAEVEVDGRELALELVVEDVVGAVALHVNIHVVTAELIAERRAGEAAGVDGQVGACLQALAQPDGDVGVHGHGRLQRNVESQLYGGILLDVVAEAGIELHRLALAGRQYHVYAVGLLPFLLKVGTDGARGGLALLARHHAALGRLVEQVDAHGRGDFLFQPGVDVGTGGQVELLAQEALVLRCHVLEGDVDDAVLLGHHLGTQRMVFVGAETLVDADALFQRDNLVPVSHGLLLAAAHQRVDGVEREAGGVVALGVDSHVEVGHLDVLVDFVLTVDVDNLTQDAHGAAQVLGTLRRSLHGDADDDVGAHFAGNVNGVVVLQTTVDQHFITYSDGREGCGNGHRGTHGLWQSAVVENDLRVVDNVRGHAGEGNLQVVGEVERVGIARAELLEQLGQVLALDDAAGLHVLLADGQTGGEGVGVLLTPVAKALPSQVLLVGDDIAPVLHAHHRVERVGVVTDGVETADDTAHRRAGDVVDGDVSLLQHLQHADVCHTLGATATQYDRHLLALLFRGAALSVCHAAYQHGDGQK